MSVLLTALQYLVLLFSLILHEVAHGTMALRLGDTTAKDMGRLTFNPLKHLDPVGSVLMPIFTYLISLGRFAFGWAKPVPFNPLNFKNPLRDTALTAAAGPLANFALAALLSLVVRFRAAFHLSGAALEFIQLAILINLVWFVFNLIVIPPFDGSKILFYFTKGSSLEKFLYRYSLPLLLIILIFGSDFVVFIASIIFKFLTGIPIPL